MRYCQKLRAISCAGAIRESTDVDLPKVIETADDGTVPKALRQNRSHRSRERRNQHQADEHRHESDHPPLEGPRGNIAVADCCLVTADHHRAVPKPRPERPRPNWVGFARRSQSQISPATTAMIASSPIAILSTAHHTVKSKKATRNRVLAAKRVAGTRSADNSKKNS